MFYLIYVRRSALEATTTTSISAENDVSTSSTGGVAATVAAAAQKAARRVPLPDLLKARGDLSHLEQVRAVLGMAPSSGSTSARPSVEREAANADAGVEEETALDGDVIMGEPVDAAFDGVVDLDVELD